jgi:glycerol-3-phosphate acyltransferase PlsY
MTGTDILILISCFVLGAIPFSIIIGKIFFGVDVRTAGSGNPGATNTFRVLGKPAGLAVLALDISKGMIAVVLSRYMSIHPVLTPDDLTVICGGISILGHIYSPFLIFKGGKGVATATGVVFALQPQIGLVCVVIFALIFITTKYVSLGSMLTALLLPIAYYIIYGSHDSFDRAFIGFGILLAVLIIYKHKTNIRRLINGEESKMRLKKAKI